MELRARDGEVSIDVTASVTFEKVPDVDACTRCPPIRDRSSEQTGLLSLPSVQEDTQWVIADEDCGKSLLRAFQKGQREREEGNCLGMLTYQCYQIIYYLLFN